MIPMIFGSIIFQFYQIVCGMLQALGRSMFYGVAQMTSFFLNMFIFDPLFLLYFKFGLWGASLATVISSLLPLILILILLFNDKFEIKVKFSQFFEKFSEETYSALKMGLSYLVVVFSVAFPIFILLKLLGNRSKEANMHNLVFFSVSIVVRIFDFIMSINMSLSQGLLPAAAFAYGSKRYHRFKWLCYHCFWLGTSWATFCQLIVIIFSKQIIFFWSSDPIYISWASRYLIISMYTTFLAHFQYVCVVALQSCKKIKEASIASILTQLVPIPLFSFLIYYLDSSKNPANLMYSYVGNDIFSLIVVLYFYFTSFDFALNAEKSDEMNLNEKI